MRVFLSYAAEQRVVAEAIELALRNEGHNVFFDRSSLPAGEAYNERIRSAIVESDLFIFLISPESVSEGRYTRTELELAQTVRQRPSTHLLPVMVRPTELALVPPYLKAVTILQPRGDVAAAVAAAVARMPSRRRTGPAWAAIIVAVLIGAGAIGWRVQQQRALSADVARLLESAQSDQRVGKYAEAWTSGEQAETLSRGNPDVELARARIAMDWLDHIRVVEGKETFTSIVQKVDPLLVRCAESSENQTAADCEAHLGWADFLQSRENGGAPDPSKRYQRALERDPRNAYAHAMSGFEVLRTGGKIDVARHHFEQALASGRERPYVRRLQIAGLLWQRDAETGNELVRVAQDMRLHGEALHDEPNDSDLWRLWDVYYDRLINGHELQTFLSALPAPDHLATFRWAFQESKVPDIKTDLYLFMRANLEEHAGERAEALATYKTLHDILVRRGALTWGGPVPDRTVAALKRLSPGTKSGTPPRR